MATRERYYHDNGQWATMKAEIRNTTWQLLVQQGVARFPGAHSRIPNFVGADKAARLLRELTVWRKAQVITVNPDAPQLPVRRAVSRNSIRMRSSLPENYTKTRQVMSG